MASSSVAVAETVLAGRAGPFAALASCCCADGYAGSLAVGATAVRAVGVGFLVDGGVPEAAHQYGVARLVSAGHLES